MVNENLFAIALVHKANDNYFGKLRQIAGFVYTQ